MTPKALKSLRVAIGWSIHDFALCVRIPEETLRRWEGGEEKIDMTALSAGLERLWPPTYRPAPPRLRTWGHS